MNFRDDLKKNVDQVNERLDAIKGDHPTDVVQTHMAIANVFMLGALVNAVQDLTEQVRTSNRGGVQLGRTIEFMTALIRTAVNAETPAEGIAMLREVLAEVDALADE